MWRRLFTILAIRSEVFLDADAGGLQGAEGNRLRIGQFEEVAGGGVDDGEGIVDFMGDATGHQADSGQACGRDGLDTVEFDFFFHALAFGDVADVALDYLFAVHGIDITDNLDFNMAAVLGKQGQIVVADDALGLQLGEGGTAGGNVLSRTDFPELLSR